MLFNLRKLYARMNEKIEAAEKKGVKDELLIESKISMVSVISAIDYIQELYGKAEQLESKIIDQQIINLNLLISNKQKDEEIKNRDEKINELLERV